MTTRTPWPAVGHEEHQWVHRDPLASKRARVRNTGTFPAAVVPHIAGLSPELPDGTLQSVREASRAITVFDAQWAHAGGTPFAAVLLRGESASSSQIENLTAYARKLSLASLGASVGGNAELVARNVRAMEAAIAAAQHLDLPAVLRMHHELMDGVHADAGKLREEWVWIGKDSPVTAAYVGPHHSAVTPAMQDLIQFMTRQDLDPLVQAAIAHAQFETIHPFTDGNGRTGRALVSALLHARGAVRTATIPISSGLLHGVDEYIAALNAYRGGDVVPIVDLFATATNAALTNTELLLRDIETLRAQIHASRPRVTSALRAVARLCCTEPAFTAGMVEELADVSKPTAYRTVDALTEAGLLRAEHEKIRGQKVWTVPGLNRALDAFAERAGRRGFGGQ